MKMDKSSTQAWKDTLTPEQYAVLREKATERPFSGVYNDHWEQGMYLCAGCKQELFASDEKFDAGCGWPSFNKPQEKQVAYHEDKSHGMVRTEVICSKCGGHLGHVFDDGPSPTGKRYCINSAALLFKK